METTKETQETTASDFRIRLAEPRDTEAFVRWGIENQKVPRKDIVASMKANNPTSVVLVVEKDGVPVVFVPLYCQINLAYLGFNPDITGRERLRALEKLKQGVLNFAAEFGVAEVTVQTSKDYPVGRWALKNDFEEEPRQTFKLRVTPLVNPFEEVA